MKGGLGGGATGAERVGGRHVLDTVVKLSDKKIKKGTGPWL
jgi:hypothetical protein